MGIRLVNLATFATLALACGTIASAQEGGKPADEAFTGLAVGSKAPEFALKDQEGQARKLADLRREGMVALVFYRSADW